jgi:hypothetical protein
VKFEDTLHGDIVLIKTSGKVIYREYPESYCNDASQYNLRK